MVIMQILKVTLSIILILGITYYLFPLGIVNGNSMYPTLKDGDILITTRLFKLREGSIYIYKREDKLIIKRLSEKIKPKGQCQTFCYFLGDNPEKSYDSRDYGYVNSENIKAKKLIILKRNKNGGK